MKTDTVSVKSFFLRNCTTFGELSYFVLFSENIMTKFFDSSTDESINKLNKTDYLFYKHQCDYLTIRPSII